MKETSWQRGRLEPPNMPRPVCSRACPNSYQISLYTIAEKVYAMQITYKSSHCLWERPYELLIFFTAVVCCLLWKLYSFLINSASNTFHMSLSDFLFWDLEILVGAYRILMTSISAISPAGWLTDPQLASYLAPYHCLIWGTCNISQIQQCLVSPCQALKGHMGSVCRNFEMTNLGFCLHGWSK